MYADDECECLINHDEKE